MITSGELSVVDGSSFEQDCFRRRAGIQGGSYYPAKLICPPSCLTRRTGLSGGVKFEPDRDPSTSDGPLGVGAHKEECNPTQRVDLGAGGRGWPTLREQHLHLNQEV